MPHPFTARYDAGLRVTGGACPIEAGVIGRLADHECRHGRLPGDRTAPCGCWPREGALVLDFPARSRRRAAERLRRAA